MTMLVARAQLNFVTDLVARFERYDSMMRPVAEYQSQYIAIIALLRSVGHVFDKVDCADDQRRSWSTARWREWKQAPIFREFIEPARNVLLKEFQGGLELRNSAFDTIAVVADPGVPDGVSHVAAFDSAKLRDAEGRPILPKIREALTFWDRCLKEAEAQLPEAAT
ncbi:hypothetical protein G6K98_02420 [Agrobacterium rhizogenes]|nr:hypothetical protein [Rhizobium rhizogenes]NTH56834.1 hypothetical protein [Rhizobium rhizogenes]NTH87984.1 hypothetical protein [Rhizobium rhizogenes]